MILLGVNVDHVATLRQARYRDEPNTFGGFVEPDPASMAWLAEDAGADGITMHIREDRRHVQVEDVQRYLERKKTRLNLEVSLSGEMVELALSLKAGQRLPGAGKPHGGNHRGWLGCGRQPGAGPGKWSMYLPREVSPPVCSLIQTPLSWKHQQRLDPLGWNCTPAVLPGHGHFPKSVNTNLGVLTEGMEIGLSLGLQVNAGHGINYENVEGARKLDRVTEFNIGHSIICRSLRYGLSEAVSTMRQLLNS